MARSIRRFIIISLIVFVVLLGLLYLLGGSPLEIRPNAQATIDSAIFQTQQIRELTTAAAVGGELATGTMPTETGTSSPLSDITPSLEITETSTLEYSPQFTDTNSPPIPTDTVPAPQVVPPTAEPLGAIAGIAFGDINGNGNYDPSQFESGISGTFARLFENGCQGNGPQIESKFVAPSGAFGFSNLSPGSKCLRIIGSGACWGNYTNTVNVTEGITNNLGFIPLPNLC